jgi:adenine/guanine phosphoribosyltransferase-like PRPP-binding protein
VVQEVLSTMQIAAIALEGRGVAIVDGYVQSGGAALAVIVAGRAVNNKM